VAVRGRSQDSAGVLGSSITSAGVQGQTSATGQGGVLAAVSSAASNIVALGLRVRHTTSAAPAPGFGVSIQFAGETVGIFERLLGRLMYQWTDAVDATRTSKFQIETVNSAAATVKLEVLGSGQLVLNEYTTSTSFSSGLTSQGLLNVDGSGKVFVTTAPTGTGTVTNVATGTGLTGGPITTTGTISLNTKLAPADSIAGNAGKFLRVNSGATAVEYADVASGGGGGRSYYLNGSVIQGTFAGIVDMKEISPVPVIGTGTDFTINTNGYIESFITDAGDPNKAVIPAGNWNFELWFSVNNSGGSPNFYVELSKYDGVAFTLIATGSANPTNITTTVTTLYITALSVPLTTLLLTDRLAVRVFVNHGGGSRVVTLHTQGPHLSQIITDFPSGITSLNGLTAFVQNFATPGTAGTAPNWSSALDTHTLNIPLASTASVTAGLISNTQYSNLKTGSCGVTFDGGGQVVQTKIAYVQMPYNGTLGAWSMVADQTGACTIAVSKSTFAGFPPTSAVYSVNPAISAGFQTATAPGAYNSGMATVTAGDVLKFEISAITSITWVNLSISIAKS
jgi:hypothetical protein